MSNPHHSENLLRRFVRNAFSTKNENAMCKEERYKQILYGFVLGILLGIEVDHLGLSSLIHWEDPILFLGVVGAFIALTRVYKIFSLSVVGLLFILLVVGYTPLASFLIRQTIRSDTLHSVPAIVVLSSAVHKDKSLSAAAQERLIQGYLLLRQKIGARLILTQATTLNGSQVPTVRRQMEILGFDYPIYETGPVIDTHDEAIEVARMAKAHGWGEIILVTHPWHMRRAAGVFQTSGISVLCSPCVEGRYDLDALDTPPGRFAAFRDWLHETVGYYVYRCRGWIK